MDNAIVVSGLRKSYGDLEALKGIDFTVKTGEVLALLGPNGAGKTTTVEILEGYRKKSAGTVEILGEDPERGGPRYKERVGIVLQECSIDPFLRVVEVLRQRVTFYSRPLDVDEILELTGLVDKRNEKVKRLSGGLQRRLDLALALVGNPEVIFLDEPTTGFDPSARHESWDIIRTLCSQGRTVLLTTHYMDEAQNLADKVVIIAKGQIVAQGTPETLGGRDSAATQITFSISSTADLERCPVTHTVESRENMSFVTIESTSPVEDLSELTKWWLGSGISPGNLNVSQPSLEDMYLRITRDSEAL